MKDLIIGIDIGGTHVRIGAVNMDGRVEHLEKSKSRILCEGGRSIDLLLRFIRDYIDRWQLTGRVRAITAGFPSPVDKKKTIVLSCPNLSNPNGSFDGCDVVSPLQEEFKVPIFIEKDSVFLLSYDLTLKNLQGTTLGIYFGTGIGNMVCIDGEFLSGRHGVACDLGHIPFYLSDRYCTCGNRGCVECYASGRILYDIWRENFSDTDFESIFELHTDSREIQNYIEAMAVPIASEINIFDPDNVILGGGVVEMRSFPMEMLKDRVYEFSRKPFPGKDFVYIKASNAVDIGIAGGAFYAMKKLGLK